MKMDEVRSLAKLHSIRPDHLSKSELIKTIQTEEGNFDCFATEAYGDLLEMGILDPTKVTRCALQNAASIASLILTTDAMIAELPKDEDKLEAMGAMGM
jgi:chaperonin GroEL